jgi:hypothetical protein
VDHLHRPIAVIDTNVLVDVLSSHDVLNAYGMKMSLDVDMVYRRARARDSLILFEHLHRRKAWTVNLRDEPWNVLSRVGPVGHLDGRVYVATRFLFADLWRDWRRLPPDESPTPEPTGTKADRMLVSIAKAYDLPLITNEGHSKTGVIDEGKAIRRFAREDGVDLCTPVEFWHGQIDAIEASYRILTKFRNRRGFFIKGQSDVGGLEGLLDEVFDYLQYILFSEQYP